MSRKPGRRGPAWWGVAALAAVLIGLPAAAPRAQSVVLSIDLTMTRGPSDAPVTIIEFSDYQ